MELFVCGKEDFGRAYNRYNKRWFLSPFNNWSSNNTNSKSKCRHVVLLQCSTWSVKPFQPCTIRQQSANLFHVSCFTSKETDKAFIALESPNIKTRLSERKLSVLMDIDDDEDDDRKPSTKLIYGTKPPAKKAMPTVPSISLVGIFSTNLIAIQIMDHLELDGDCFACQRRANPYEKWFNTRTLFSALCSRPKNAIQKSPWGTGSFLWSKLDKSTRPLRCDYFAC